MGDEGVMAGANCKRYLQNKLIDRKRRRPTSALLESAEIGDEQIAAGDATTRLRQTTTRQSTQRHLISAINSLSTPNKADVITRITTTSSKKYLKPTNQGNEPLNYYDDDDLKKQCSSPDYDTMSLTDSEKNDINASKSSIYLENGNSHDGYNNFNEMEREEDLQNTLSYIKKDPSAKEENDNSKDSRIQFETINESDEYRNPTFDCNTGRSSNITLPNINDLCENSHPPSSGGYGEIGNVAVAFKNNGTTTSLIDEEKNDDLEVQKTNESERFVFTPTPSIHELQCHNLVQKHANNSPSRRTHISSNDDEKQVLDENDSSHRSNSLCSDSSCSSAAPSCPVLSDSKQPLDGIIPTEIENNQKHATKSTNEETMKSSLLNISNHPPQNMTTSLAMSKSKRDEQYHSYKSEDDNQECAIKSSPTSSLPQIDINSQTKSEDCNKSDNNSEFQNECFQQSSTKNDCPNVLSSIVTSTIINYIRVGEKGEVEQDEENERLSKTEVSISNDCKDIVGIETISLGQVCLNDEQNKGAAEKLQESLENQHQQNDNDKESRNFDKFLDKSSPRKQVEFEAQSNGRINHQQHERDIIDAADKVYSQIEEQYRQQHDSTVSTTYEQMINNHQRQQQLQHQNNPHQHEEIHQRHDVDSLQMQTLQHSMQQQQAHFSAEQLYQLQQQQEHHQQIQMQRQQMQKQEELQQQQQQQQHHQITANQQRDNGQQHSHLMDFLHPQHHHPNVSNTNSPLHQQHQQQHQIHEVYHDLMMDEFHEEHNTPYKLGLSPSTVKHENQDDGYETSAGDVLTPNSHASSTHSVTPQHHLHHGGVPTNAVKCEEQHQQHSMRLQQTQHNTHVTNEQNLNIQRDLVPNESSVNMSNRDQYHFMDDDINSATNNSLRNILTPPHSHTRSNQEGGSLNGFMVMQSEPTASANLNSTNDMYNLANSSIHHHHSQKPLCLDTNSNTPIVSGEHQHYTEASSEIVSQEQDTILNLQTKSIQKRRGRKKKIPEDGLQPMLDRSNPNDANTITGFTKTKERKKHDRFNGMSEEEVVKRILPDHLCDNLDIVIIGINPGLFAAYKGHHYAGPGNHFWKCLYLSGLTQEQMNADEDFKLMKYGIGFTNMVQRATKGSADLTRKEIKEGSRILLEKLQRFRPKIAVFNGKLIFEVFSGKKDFNFGRQPECVEGTDTFIWVMPSSSARCAQLPRAADKVPFYAALKKFRDYLNGLIPHIDQSECVFTEERIKQQCEQENYKNQQNNTTSRTDSTYQNVVGISNANSSLQNPVGYSFDSESNPHGAGEGPGPPPPLTADGNASNSFMMSSLVGTHHEKKKRGRPKKIKGDEIIDPVTGNKVQVNTQMISANNGEYADILNLSVISSSEMPKKKRGRPKKVKPHPSILQHDIAQSTSTLSQKPSIMSIQSLTSDITQGSPHHMQGLQTNHQHVALYSTPPPHQRSIYSPMASPMVSPSLNCSYTTNTPPSQIHHDKLGLPNSGGRESSKGTSTDLVLPAHHQQHPIPDQNFGESPPPSSPNINTVDFEPPTGSTAASSIVSDNVNSELNTLHQRLHSTHERSRFNSPISGEATPDHNANEHFQQWLSPQPNHSIHSPATATMFVNSPQHSSLTYHDQQQQQQQQQMQTIQQQQEQHQEMHQQWPLRHQSRYDDLANGPFLLSSQIHQTHSHNQANHNQPSQHGSSDVARKSLSGLESLVDQIPTISESESIALSSAAAVNAQVAAAAAVESRLQGMQNSSLGDSQVGEDSHFSSIAGPQTLLTASNSPTSAPTNNNQIQQSNTASSSLLNSNFSVSNLAASSASSNNNNNSNSHENYALTSNARPLTNPNVYHHSNLMAAAVLAAAAANTPTNLSTPAVAGTNNHHASMYMDPHAHLTTHVPVNSIYTSAAPTHHHHSAVSAHHHHHAASHYGSAQHSAADYATATNPYAAAQGNVTTSHTLHMPSPNYPYGYPTSTTQSNYSAYPHSHHANHHHGHPHPHHTPHHLAMFDRLKPSDITGYSSGF